MARNNKSEKSKETLLPHSLSEKKPLLGSPHDKRRSTDSSWLSGWRIPCMVTIALVLVIIFGQGRREADGNREDDAQEPMLAGSACPQFPALEALSVERQSFMESLKHTINSGPFLEKSIKRMQGAVQIPTESFDDMGEVGEDKRWEALIPFQEYLNKTFPLVYSKLDVKYVNTYGLLFEWKGSDEALKPYLFMAHQDVVPVLQATESKWTYPPYSAHYDGRFIWGRGASDCKNVLIGVLEAFETLLESGHQPKRTMLAAFGFDEEISGFHGAAYLASEIERTKGKDSVELIIDEGGLGIREMYGVMFALPGLGEKGYQDVKITVETAGGHSSVPPDQTGIGILSRIVAAIEDTPYEPELTPINPYFTTLQCGAEYGTDMDDWLRDKIKESLKSKKAAKEVAEYLANDDIGKRYLMQTSQATDLISGGVKVNALPEKVYAVVNHRIAVESSVNNVQERMKSVVSDKILSRFPMSLSAWGEVTGNTSSTSRGVITLETFDHTLEPAPVSPFDSDAYKVFTGTIKQVFGADYIVAPSVMTGNTDTRFYWNLSENIYRFAPVREEGRANGHTVDERIGMKEHLEGVHFYVQMVLNGDKN